MPVVRASGDDESLLDRLNPLKKLQKAQEERALEKSRRDANKLLSDEQGEQLFGKGLMGKLATGMVNNIGGAVRGEAWDYIAFSKRSFPPSRMVALLRLERYEN